MGAITTAFVKQFGNTIDQLSQQKGSRLQTAVRVESGVVGEKAFYDQLGASTAIKKTTRHSDTPVIPADNERRMVTMYDYEIADLIDKEDQLKMIVDPKSAYAQSFAWALGRAKDDALITAALGTAYTGKEGTDSESFDTTNYRIVNGSAGMTVAKLAAAKEIFDAGDVDPEEQRFIAIGAKQLQDLLNTTQVTSADYNTVKALVRGELDTFMGFKFILSNRLNKASTVRQCIAWAKNGLLLAIASEVKARIDERVDKSYAWQVYASMGIGATRMEQAKVVQVDCVES